MSVKKLNFELKDGSKIEIKFKDDALYFDDSESLSYITFDRSEAHLLYIYLQEHLKESKPLEDI